MTRVLVTGINGAIAPYVVRFCLDQNATVFGLVREKKSLPKDGIHRIVADITDASAVQKAVSKTKPDFIFHLAAISTLKQSWDDPKTAIQTNLFGSLHFLDALKKTKSNATLVLAGSREEYGVVPADRMPIVETEPLNPVNPYGVAKAGADWLGQQYFEQFGIRVICARPFNHTAPVWSDRFVDSNWCHQIAKIEAGKQKPVIEVGNLSAVRDFVDCRDAAKAYWLLATRGHAGHAYNICSGIPVSMKELLNELRSYSSESIAVKKDPARVFKDQVPIAWGDNSKIRRHTKWKPLISIRQTHKELLAHWRKLYGLKG